MHEDGKEHLTPITLLRDAYTSEPMDDGALRDDIKAERIGVGIALPLSYWMYIYVALVYINTVHTKDIKLIESRLEISKMLLDFWGKDEFEQKYTEAYVNFFLKSKF